MRPPCCQGFRKCVGAVLNYFTFNWASIFHFFSYRGKTAGNVFAMALRSIQALLFPPSPPRSWVANLEKKPLEAQKKRLLPSLCECVMPSITMILLFMLLVVFGAPKICARVLHIYPHSFVRSLVTVQFLLTKFFHCYCAFPSCVCALLCVLNKCFPVTISVVLPH